MIYDDDFATIAIPPTPKYIKDNYTSGEPAVAVDVFALAFTGITYTPQPSVLTDLKAMLWQRFGRRPIGDYEYEYWLECLTEKVQYEWAIYQKSLPLLLSADLMSLITAKQTDAEDTVIGRDVTITNNLSQVEAGTVVQSGTTLTENEDHPDSQAGATKYLSGRSTVTPNITDDADKTTTNTGTVVTADDMTNGRDLTSTRYDGLTVEQTKTVINAYRTLAEIFCYHLEPMFLNRW